MPSPKDGRSEAQNLLAEFLATENPFSSLEQEVPIGRLIEEAGYTKQEIESELRFKVKKMSVDIVLTDSSGRIAFEYNGEQHYNVVKGMTNDKVALLLNQQLDRQKHDVLLRIGIPLVTIPFDAYLDSKVIKKMVQDSRKELAGENAGLFPCDGCGRLYRKPDLTYGYCRRCVIEAEANEHATFSKLVRRKSPASSRSRAHRHDSAPFPYEESVEAADWWGDAGDGAGDEEWRGAGGDDGENGGGAKEAASHKARPSAKSRGGEYMARRKEAEKLARKQRWAEYKASPEYAERKEQEKAARKKAREDWKNSEAGRAAREREKEARREARREAGRREKERRNREKREK